ncbi:hypothetical protein [Williamsia sp. M5A3_1d]
MAECSDDDVAVLTVRRGLVPVAVAAVVASIAACGLFSDGTESFRPPDAPISPLASCTLPDIVDRFDTRADHYGEREYEGSPPDGFMATSVVSCQTSQRADGATVIDAVELGGDVDAFARAVDRPSVRTDKNTSVSCAVNVDAPAAIWLVSASGAARVAWPSVVCGYRDEPLAALERLREIRRTPIRDLGVLPATVCRSGPPGFVRTSNDGSGRIPATTLRFPTGAVAGATVCTYRVSRSSTGDLQESGAESRRVTSAVASRVVRETISAPVEPTCDVDATEIAVMPLYRPDGSGGASLAVENDGCRRVTVDDGLGYRVASGEVTALLRGEA